MADITLTLTASDANRAAAAIGKLKGYTDANGAPRSATLAESKAFVIEKLQTIVKNVELKTAKEAVSVTTIAPT